MNVKLEATIDDDGHAVCLLSCDGQQVQITFTGTHVLMDLPEPAQETT